MAKCATCGGKAKMFAQECENCTGKRLAAEEAQLRAERAAKAEQRERNIEDAYTEIVKAVRGGEVRYIYDTVYVDVDSVLMNDSGALDLGKLVKTGWGLRQIVRVVHGENEYFIS